MRLSLIASLGVATALAACAPTAQTGETASARPETSNARQCFFTQQVQNFRQGRVNQIYLRANRDEVYELSGGAGCQALDFAVSLAIVPEGGGAGGTRLCVGDSARVLVPNSIAEPSVCRARVIRKLTAEEVAALPAAVRP